MAYTLLIHLVGEEAVLCEADQLPDPDDTTLTVINVRRRDGKDVNFLDAAAKSVIFPLARINFIEIMQSEEEEEIVGFARD